MTRGVSSFILTLILLCFVAFAGLPQDFRVWAQGGVPPWQSRLVNAAGETIGRVALEEPAPPPVHTLALPHTETGSPWLELTWEATHLTTWPQSQTPFQAQAVIPEGQRLVAIDVAVRNRSRLPLGDRGAGLFRTAPEIEVSALDATGARYAPVRGHELQLPCQELNPGTTITCRTLFLTNPGTELRTRSIRFQTFTTLQAPSALEETDGS